MKDNTTLRELAWNDLHDVVMDIEKLFNDICHNRASALDASRAQIHLLEVRAKMINIIEAEE